MKTIVIRISGIILWLSVLACGSRDAASPELPGGGEDPALPMEDVSEKELSPAEYVQWMQNPENGIKRVKAMDDMTFTLQYKSYEYIACIEERSEALYDTLLQRKKAELAGLQYFDLRISLNANEGEILKYKANSGAEYNQRVNYFAFGMQEAISLVEGNDTLRCALYHFERTYDVSPSCTVLLGFPAGKEPNTQQKTLLFHDRTFNKGLLKFTYIENRLQNLPKLETL